MKRPRYRSSSCSFSDSPRESENRREAAVWYESEARCLRQPRPQSRSLENAAIDTMRHLFVEAYDTSRLRNHLERVLEKDLVADTLALFQRALADDVDKVADFDVSVWFKFLRGRLAERENPGRADEIFREVEEGEGAGGDIQLRYDCLVQRGRLRLNHPSRFEESSESFFRKATKLGDSGNVPILLLRSSEVDEKSQTSFEAVTRLLAATDTFDEVRTWLVEQSCWNPTFVDVLDRVYTEHRDPSLGQKVHHIMYDTFHVSVKASMHDINAKVARWLMKYDRTVKLLFFDGLMSLAQGNRDAIPQLLLAYERNLEEGRRSAMRDRILVSLGHAFLARQDRLRAARFFLLASKSSGGSTLPFSEIPTEFARSKSSSHEGDDWDVEGGQTFADMAEEATSTPELDLRTLRLLASKVASDVTGETKVEFVFKALKYLSERGTRFLDLELRNFCLSFIREILNKGSLRQTDLVLTCLARAPEELRRSMGGLHEEVGDPLSPFERAMFAWSTRGVDEADIADELLKIPDGHSSRNRALYFSARLTQSSATAVSDPDRDVRVANTFIAAWVGGIQDSFAVDVERRLERLFEGSRRLRDMEWTETDENWSLRQLVFSRLLSGLESRLRAALATSSSKSAAVILQRILDAASFLVEGDSVLLDDLVHMIRELPRDFKEHVRSVISLEELGDDTRRQIEFYLRPRRRVS